MNASYTAVEIALALNVNKRTIQIRADKESWAFTYKKGNGGKTAHYIMGELPVTVIEKLTSYWSEKTETEAAASIAGASAGHYLVAKEKLDNEIKSKNKQGALKEFAGVTGKSKDKAYAKAQVLRLIKEFQKRTKLPKIKAIDEFCELFNKQHPSVPESLYRELNSISRATLLRWEKSYENKGIIALVEAYGKNKGSGIIESTPEMKDYCLAIINDCPHIKGAELQKALLVRFDGTYTIPSSSTCRSWLKSWKTENASLYMSMFDPSGWQNKYMAAFGKKDAGVERINQVWEFDSTPSDVMLVEGRYSIVGVIDVFTRRVKLILKPTSNAMAIACLIREALLDWGVPEVARTDNGADYLAHHIRGVWDVFDIENDITNPYSGWEKPYIERFFRTFSHGIVERLKGYIGHDVAERERISARKTFAQRLMEKREKGEARAGIEVEINAKQFQAIMDQWVNNYYHHEKHSTIGCSPFQKFTQHKQTIKSIDDERVLDVLLAPVPGNGIRTVGKEGISVEGGIYIHAELSVYMGERVLCRYNPNDVGKIYVFHALHGHFICEAVNTDIADNDITMSHALEAKRIQRANLAANRKEFKRQSKQHDVSEAAQKFLDYHTSKNGGLNAFPKQSENINTIATQSASAALVNKDKEPTYTQAELNVFEQRRKEIEMQKGFECTASIYHNDHHKARCLAIQNRDASITPAEKAWLHQYRRENPQAVKMLDRLVANKTPNQK